MQRYNPQLDALRAVAICLVLIEHFGGPWARETFPIGAGALGVSLFFVLSGYLISNNFQSRLEKIGWKQTTRMFFIGRIVRLAPAYYTTLVLMCIFQVPSVRDYIMWHVTYFSNYLVAFGGPLTVFWSLAVEEQFYLVFPFLLLISRGQGIKLALCFIVSGLLLRVAVLGTAVPLFAFEISLFGKLEILGLGVLLGTAMASGRARAGDVFASTSVRIIAILAICFQVVAWYLWGDGIVRHLTFNITVGLFFLWLVAGAAAQVGGPIEWISRLALVRYVGRISYGIYLFHNFMPELVRSTALGRQIVGENVLLQAAAIIALSFVLPALSWKFLEEPLVRYKNGVTSRLGGQAAMGERGLTPAPPR